MCLVYYLHFTFYDMNVAAQNLPSHCDIVIFIVLLL